MGLKSYVTLVRKARLKSGGKIERVGKRGRRLKPALDASYDVVDARSGGTCEFPGCGQEAAVHHHLMTRGANAKFRQDPANLAHLCPTHDKQAHDQMTEFRRFWCALSPDFADIYDPISDRPYPPKASEVMFDGRPPREVKE